MSLILLFFIHWCIVLSVAGTVTRPNIVVIIADDLGWNDVGFHGSNQIPTPNIDALAYSGIILQNYYVNPICTPSRSAFMTGKYPIHTGMHHGVIYGMEPRGLPLTEKLLPQYLKELGYINHLVGKWHLGSYKKDYLPLNRGFDTHIGFWTGRIDMYDHTSVESGTWGFDFRRGYEVAHDQFGKYATDIFTDEAVKVINDHNSSDPMFLTIAHSAVHSGNPNEPIRAPDAIIDKFSNIDNFQRRKYAAVLTKLDESVGKVVKALDKKGILENTIVLFTTDNGGPAAGFNDNAASNYPLKGVKNTLWEGGIRGAGFLWSPLLKKRSRVAEQRMHIADWLPTLITAAGGNNSALPNIDGIDLWSALSNDLPSHRNLIIHNIDDEIVDNIYGSASLTLDQWKIIKGTNYKGAWDSWYGPDGRSGAYDPSAIFNSDAGHVMKSLNMLPDNDRINNLRSTATVNCGDAPLNVCNPLSSPCLYNIVADPCERNNLAESNPDIVQKLLGIMNEERKTIIPSTHRTLDRRGDPKYWGRVFFNFADYNTYSCS